MGHGWGALIMKYKGIYEEARAVINRRPMRRLLEERAIPAKTSPSPGRTRVGARLKR